MARNFTPNSVIQTTTTPITAVPLTIACRFNADAVFGFMVCISDAGATPSSFFLAADTILTAGVLNSASGFAGANTSNSFTLGAWSHAVGTFTSATQRNSYLNGTANSGSSVGNITPDSLDRIAIGAQIAGGTTNPGEGFDGRLAEVAFWNVVLATDQIQAYMDGFSPLLIRPDALQFYAPLWGRKSPEIDVIGNLTCTISGTATLLAHPPTIIPSRPHFPTVVAAAAVAGGGTTPKALFIPGAWPDRGLTQTRAYPADIVLRTITAEAGAYAITGTAATLLHKRVLAAGAGSYAVTGTAATLRRTYLLAADAGSYAITGTAASLEYGYTLAAEAGTYAITGTAATLTRTYVLSATAGSYTITGTAADLIYAAGRILTADVGTYAITGTAATLSRTYILSAVGGSYTIAGTAASLLHKYVLAADSGVYTITGTAVSLLQKYVLSADAGAYTITGTDATLLKSGAIVLSADSGVYTITGTAADLIYNVPSPAGGGLKHYPARRIDISKPRPRQFGRKCWEELRAAHFAQLALERKAEKAKQEGARQALLQASHEAQEAILAVLEAAAVNAACEHEVGRLARSLQAAVGAKSLAGVISTTDAVMAAAAALEREIEDEDETIILLLS